MHTSARSPSLLSLSRAGSSLRGLRAVLALVTVTAAGTAALGACATPSEQLARAEAHYQNRAYAAAMANLEDLTPHRDGMNRSERVRYDVARGLSHLNLSEREDARHWLALAREEAVPEPTTLTSEQRAVIERVMTETDPLAAGGAAAARPSAAPSATR